MSGRAWAKKGVSNELGCKVVLRFLVLVKDYMRVAVDRIGGKDLSNMPSPPDGVGANATNAAMVGHLVKSLPANDWQPLFLLDHGAIIRD